jgi:hypothetical protein
VYNIDDSSDEEMCNINAAMLEHLPRGELPANNNDTEIGCGPSCDDAEVQRAEEEAAEESLRDRLKGADEDWTAFNERMRKKSEILTHELAVPALAIINCGMMPGVRLMQDCLNIGAPDWWAAKLANAAANSVFSAETLFPLLEFHARIPSYFIELHEMMHTTVQLQIKMKAIGPARLSVSFGLCSFNC